MNKVFASVLFAVQGGQFYFFCPWEVLTWRVWSCYCVSPSWPGNIRSSLVYTPGLSLGIASPVDLTGLYQLSERQIKKETIFQPAVGGFPFPLLESLQTKNKGTLKRTSRSLYEPCLPFTTYCCDLTTRQRTISPACGDASLLWHGPGLAAKDQAQTDIMIYLSFCLTAPSWSTDYCYRGIRRRNLVASKQTPGMREVMATGMRPPTLLWTRRIVSNGSSGKLHIFSPSNPLSYVWAIYILVSRDGWEDWAVCFPFFFFRRPFASPLWNSPASKRSGFPGGLGCGGGVKNIWSLAYMFLLARCGAKDRCGCFAGKHKKPIMMVWLWQAGGPVKHNIPADKNGFLRGYLLRRFACRARWCRHVYGYGRYAGLYGYEAD